MRLLRRAFYPTYPTLPYLTSPYPFHTFYPLTLLPLMVLLSYNSSSLSLVPEIYEIPIFPIYPTTTTHSISAYPPYRQHPTSKPRKNTFHHTNTTIYTHTILKSHNTPYSRESTAALGKLLSYLSPPSICTCCTSAPLHHPPTSQGKAKTCASLTAEHTISLPRIPHSPSASSYPVQGQ